MAALASDDRIPAEIISLQEALDISDRVLTQKYGQPESAARLISENRGSSNAVKVYEKRYGGKNIRYAVRKGTYAAFKIVGDSYIRTPNVALLTEHESNSYESNTVARENFLQEVKDSEKNWKKANEKGLSPELYFYGYIKQGHALTLCTISEAFNMDLAGFISTYGFGDDAMQNVIANQLITLFTEMPKKMSMICFDIKPQNTVIKFNLDENNRPILDDNFILKLIDWDADWCRDYQFLRGRGIGPAASQKAAATIMIMVMANFFYYYNNNNILSDYMKAFYNEEGSTFTTTKVMMNLFEAGYLRGANTTEFAFMAKHYFRMDFQDDKERFLTEMFKRSMCKNEAEYQSTSDSIDITLRGGNKKKKKTRRRRKTKTKKKTKKKNKKNRKTRSKRKKRKRKTKKRN
jgi:hypothetical protein